MFAAACARVQFHLPKTLAMALCVEAAELLEQFQWLAQAASATRTPIKRLQVGEEMADVLSYRIRLAGRLEIDLADAARCASTRAATRSRKSAAAAENIPTCRAPLARQRGEA